MDWLEQLACRTFRLLLLKSTCEKETAHWLQSEDRRVWSLHTNFLIPILHENNSWGRVLHFPDRNSELQPMQVWITDQSNYTVFVTPKIRIEVGPWLHMNQQGNNFSFPGLVQCFFISTVRLPDQIAMMMTNNKTSSDLFPILVTNG